MGDTDKYAYVVNFVIDVQRTDGDHLNDHENEMVQEMRVAAEAGITVVMEKHGQNNRLHLGNDTKKY